MTRTIRELTSVSRYIEITAGAYPGVDVSNIRAKLTEALDHPNIHPVEVVENGEIVGVARFHDFTMRFFDSQFLVGGLAGVAVDLRHKKKKVAFDLVNHFVDFYRRRGAPMAALFSFRPDFYRNMGFGYAAKMDQYSFPPLAIPVLPPHGVIPLTHLDNGGDLLMCYARCLTHGLFYKTGYSLRRMFESSHVFGWKDSDGVLRGYLVFTFQNGPDFLTNDILVRELVYETPDAFLNLMAFLRSQADQVRRIRLQTQDETFHFFLDDPRTGGPLMPSAWHESNTQGVGLMLRVTDVHLLFAYLKGHDFGGQTCEFSLRLNEPEGESRYTIAVQNGRAKPVFERATENSILIGTADFSSLISGAVGLKQLVGYGLAAVTGDLETMHKVFWTDRKPKCLTSF